MPKGESVEFGELAILLSLRDALTSDQLVGSSPEELDVFAKQFTIELGDAIKKAGTEGQSAVSQSILNLVSNGAKLHQTVLKALQVAKQKGGSFTLKDLGMTDEEIAQFVSSTAGLTNDPALTAGIKELIPNYDEVLNVLSMQTL